MSKKSKITKELVISKSITFIAIVSFIIAFKTIFGDNNTLIGVTTVTAILMCLGVDFTNEPLENTLKLIAINLGSGIAAYITGFNMWIAIPINFIVVFLISNKFYYNLKTPLYLPFSLQYLFIIATPVSSSELPMRLIALLVGPLLIMAVQLVLNKNKITKSGNKLIVGICEEVIKKIKSENTTEVEEINASIKSNVNDFRKMVYDSRKDDFYITEEGRIKLDIVVVLEKLSNLIDRKENDEESKMLIEDIYVFLDTIKRNFGKEENILSINNNIDEFLKSHENKEVKDFITLEFLNNVKILRDSLEELFNLGKENYKKVKSSNDIPEKFKKINVFKNEIYNKSVKFSYSVRVSLGITISIFIADFFNLAQGKWIYFTALSLIIPIYELSKQKTLDRLFATFVGGIIVVILFSIFKDALSRTIILLLSGYLSSYTSRYRYATIYTTISAIGAATLAATDVNIFTIDRLLFVTLGAVIAIIINKAILTIDMKEANKQLEVMYANSINEMLETVYEDTINGTYDTHKIDNLLIVTSMIEEKFAANNNALISKEESAYLEEERLLVINIHELYTLISKNMIKEVDINYILEDLKSLVDYENENISQVINKVEEHILAITNVNDKVILANIREIFIGLFKVNKLKKQINI